MKKLILSTVFFSAFIANSLAQLRYYGTKSYETYLSEIGVRINTEEPNITELKLPVTLSVVFVILSKGITKDQILKQVLSTNEDFGNITFDKSESQNPNYKHLATDTEIRFCENFGFEEAYTEDRLEFALCREYGIKYAEVYKNSIIVFVGDFEQIAGFTQSPHFISEPSTIFVDKDYLMGGNIDTFSNGKTLTHLLGSFLGLGEMWDCVDDGIVDTPNMSSEHFEKEGAWSSCYRYVVHTMPQNFMYNTQDKYHNMFTLGQKEKMITVLSTLKSSLLETTTCKLDTP